MSSEYWLVVLILVVLINLTIRQTLAYLNTFNWQATLPADLVSFYNQAQYDKARAYHRERHKVTLIEQGLRAGIVIVVLLTGFFGQLNAFLGYYVTDPLFQATAYLLVFGTLSGMFSLVFTGYRIFWIEERFGFNRMTLKLFLADKLKGVAVGLVLGLPLFMLLFWSILWLGNAFWLYATALTAFLSLGMAISYTSLILPLFNKLTHLPDGPLKAQLKQFCEQFNFPVSKIYTMNGSLRNSKANAFFSGIGGARSIVLFDTLISQFSRQEIIAILAHETGHYRHRHTLKGMVLSLVASGIWFFLMAQVVFDPGLSSALGADQWHGHLNLLAFTLLYAPVSLAVGVVANHISRKFEYAADAFAARTAGKKPLISSLQRLAGSHLDHLQPHPAYSFVFYSHPPVPARIRALEALYTESRGTVN